MKRIVSLLLALLFILSAVPEEAVAITGTEYQEPTATPRPSATPKPTKAPVKNYTIKAVGAYIQEANNQYRAFGKKYSSVQITNKDSIFITAEGEKVAYWVINGVRYDFDQNVHTIRLTKATQDFTIEAVQSKSSTLLSAKTIQAQRTGEQLVVESKDATMQHLETKNAAGGSSFTRFNFTEDYENKATGKEEKGGQVSLYVRARVPKGYWVRGWKFNDTELYPTSQFGRFFVRTLNASMTYEPIFGKLAATKKPTKAPTKKPTKKPTKAPTPVAKVRVNCINCTFSGGGYSGATSGSVPKGTTITVTSNFGYSSHWEINGSFLGKKLTDEWGDPYYDYTQAGSLSRKINSDTTFRAYPIIN